MPLRRTRPVTDPIAKSFSGEPLRGSRIRLAEVFSEAPLYAVIDTAVRPELSCVEILDSLLHAGVKVVQYRHKGQFRRAQFEECCALARRCRESGAKFFVNDRADIAELCEADGVHLGQEDLPPDKARLFLGAGKLIGYSTHNLEQANAALALPIDYIAVGPVFQTGSKVNPDPVVGTKLVSEVRAIASVPVVAIGGITFENAPAVLKAGASAVAVIGDLLKTADIEARAREFLDVLRRSS